MAVKLTKETIAEKLDGLTTNENELYQDSGFKVLALASLIIVVSIALLGLIVYSIAEREVVKKLKEQDLIYIAESVATKIDGRIARAKETSVTLANDPYIAQWLTGGEQDIELTGYVTGRLQHVTGSFDYDNAFIVSTATNNYWAETGEVIDVMSREYAPHDWFFNFIEQQKMLEVNIDYNEKRKDTYVFINVLIGEQNHPLGAIGVGLNLIDLSDDLGQYLAGQGSSIWLVANNGMIYLSNQMEHNGHNLASIMPQQFAASLVQIMNEQLQEPQVFEYHAGNDILYDVILYPTKEADWNLVLQLDRRDSVGLLGTIKIHSIAIVVLLIISVCFFFYFVSRYLANPYKRALIINQELENKVQERTKSLVEKNQKILDSIDYAKRLQQSILPTGDSLKYVFREYFLLWKPKDIVGGDFYWYKKTDRGLLVAVGDCTGHGVPGALMTMLSISLLNQIDEKTLMDPAAVLSQLNAFIKETLNQQGKSALTDDGLDIGICFFDGNNKLTYAGAKIDLYLRNNRELNIIKGQRKSIGYQRTQLDYQFTNTMVEVKQDDVFYMVTDGLVDQNGGSKGYSFGKRRFAQFVESNYPRPLHEQRELLRDTLLEYKGSETQRDDITVIGFKLK